MSDFFPNYIQAIKAIRQVSGLGLRETLAFMAATFGFEGTINDEDGQIPGWRELRKWCDENRVSLESVQGPHAITILKAIAAKHGRLNVSTQR